MTLEGNAPAPAEAEGQASDAGGTSDPFEFGTDNQTPTTPAPEAESGQGEKQPEGGQPTTPQAQPAAPTTGKNYLTEEFGGDATKLNASYSELRAKMTRDAQELSTTRGQLTQHAAAVQQFQKILNFLDQHAGPDIQRVLKAKGFIEDDGSDEASAEQPAGNSLTARDVKALINNFHAEKEEFNTSLNTRVAEFASRNKGWETHKEAIGQVIAEQPQIAEAVANGTMPLDLLLHIAKGRTFDDTVETVRKQTREEASRAKQTRQQAHVETGGAGAVGGGDDPFDFIK